MPTIQIWVKDYDMELLGRLKRFFEYEVDEEFEGKTYRLSSPYRRRGRRIRSRIKRPKINDAFIFRKILYHYWIDKEEEIVNFEKSERDR